jgi:Fe-S-cluster containining protein
VDTEALGKFKETILRDYPKLSLSHTFRFSCHKDIECFNQCCADVNIFLTPYDILRMKRRLNISSSEFLVKYTDSITIEDKGLPLVVLKMRQDEKKTCPFVMKDGCSIYDDRPWPCRMYPIGMAAPDRDYGGNREAFYFIVDQEFPCLGFKEKKECSIKEWKEDQGANIYDIEGEPYKDITLHRFFLNGNRLTPEKSRMFNMVCYDIDRFRRFVFESSFINMFDIDKETIENIKSDDKNLLEFGYRWLRFSLFGEDSLMVKERVLNKKREELGLQ